MDDLLLTQEIWDDAYYECPCYDTLNRLCSAKHGQMEKIRCEFDTCPFVFWMNTTRSGK